jgi:sugar phosphate isomerase/epimerase
MKIGIDGLKLPGAAERGPIGSLDLAKELGLAGVFFSTVLDMSPTLDAGILRDIRAHADRLGMYLEAGLGKVNPFCSAEAPQYRAIGDGDIAAGFRRMMEASAEIGCRELWISMGNFKSAYRGRLAVDRFRTDVTWPDQLAATEKFLLKLAPIARDLGIHMNMETHDEITSFEIVRMIETVGADAMGVVFDTANGLQRGEHPAFAARRLAPFVRQTHVRDAYVAHAPGGLDFQPRALGDGIVDFRQILPVLAAANPKLNLSFETEYSSEDRRRSSLNPRQCIQIYDPIWLAGHPDLTLVELAAYLEDVHKYEERVRTGETSDWESHESLLFGYPSYERQSFGFAAAIENIHKSVAYLRTVCAQLKINVN